MSRNFIGLCKLSPYNHALIHKWSFRLFSSSLTTPYLTLGTTVKNDLPDGSDIRDILLFDPAKEEMLTIPNKTFPEELVDSRQIGSGRGWGVFSNDHERSLCISDLYNHSLASKSNPTMIPLPSLASVHSNQINVVWNVAMSSSSPRDEDFVVAIKLLDRQLSLCRPHCDVRWTNLGEMLFENNLQKLENSNLMYSKRDRRFYLPGPGGNSLYSWDPHLKKNKSPKIHELLFRDLPELDDSEWKLLGWCCRTEHLVDSVSNGERFLVKWYAQRFFSMSHEGTNYTTRRFMVFREKTTMEGRYMYYTEDIGDVCIFLSMSEAFCVEASSCPGLNPNSIYFIGHGFGIYNLADTTFHHFQAPEGAPTSFKDPYWLPPSCV
ncbi:hypothetical protein EUTSA_v10007942mg [Eutrema salsugineum]|uniref:KIB1-4 beta-propeller domain-containing protein n=2 Tax=Eutrema salsugineum TaxID=72664 RepID=V4KRL7_EUTSA|nr:hypothetical protein EUTSA_v10007942mg [Eutrema salsugineum]